MKNWLRTAETICWGTLGAGLFVHLGVPAGYLSGALVFVVLATLAGRPVLVPASLMQAAILALGVMIGATITPENLRLMPALWPTLLLLVLSTVVVTATSAFYLRRVHRWDRLSAVLASVPGAHSQVLYQAQQSGVELPPIAIIQVVRTTALALTLPLLLGLLDLLGPAQPFHAVQAHASWLSMLILGSVSIGIALVLRAIGLSSGLLIGSVVGAGILSGSGLVEGKLPPVLGYAAFVIVGSMVGTRFGDALQWRTLRHLVAGVGMVITSAAMTAGFVVIAVWELQAPAAETILSFAPGAIDTIFALTAAMGAAGAIATTHQIVRVLFVLLFLPLLVRMTRRNP